MVKSYINGLILSRVSIVYLHCWWFDLLEDFACIHVVHEGLPINQKMSSYVHLITGMILSANCLLWLLIIISHTANIRHSALLNWPSRYLSRRHWCSHQSLSEMSDEHRPMCSGHWMIIRCKAQASTAGFSCITWARPQIPDTNDLHLIMGVWKLILFLFNAANNPQHFNDPLLHRKPESFRHFQGLRMSPDLFS